MMTLDEAIRHAEEVAEEQEKVAEEVVKEQKKVEKQWNENNVRKCELIPFAEMNYTYENECKKRAAEYRQLAEWLIELKKLREQTNWIPISEGPPKSAGLYAVTREVAEDFRKVYLVDAFYFDGTDTWFNDNRINHSRKYDGKKIKAWKLLSEKPYKVESEDKNR